MLVKHDGLRPGQTILERKIDGRTISLHAQFRETFGQSFGDQRLATFDCRVQFRLELGAKRHPEQVTDESIEFLLKYRQLEFRIGLRLEQVGSQQSLMCVCCNLGDSHTVATILMRLGPKCMEGVHRMSALMRQRRDAPDVIGVPDQDIRFCAVYGDRVFAETLPLRGHHIHPTLERQAAPQEIYIFITERPHGLAHPTGRIQIWNLWNLTCEMKTKIASLEFLDTECPTFEFPITMPDRLVSVERLNGRIKNLPRESRLEQRMIEARGVVAGSSDQHAAVDLAAQQRDKTILMLGVGASFALIHLAPHGAICTGVEPTNGC